MVYAIIISCVSLILSLIITKKVFAPSTIVSALWLFYVVAYNVYPHPLFPLKNQFYTSISIWVGIFTLSSLFVDSIYKTPNNTHNPNKSFRNLYLHRLFITFIYTFYVIVKLLNRLGLTNNISPNLMNTPLVNHKELEWEKLKYNFFTPYLIAKTPTYKKIKPYSFDYYGENTLRFFYALTFKNRNN